MTARDWVQANLDVVSTDEDGDLIDWGNGIYTPVDVFVAMFGDTITDAIGNDDDVRQCIRDADNGRGYAALV